MPHHYFILQKRAITGNGELDWLRKHVLQIDNAH